MKATILKQAVVGVALTFSVAGAYAGDFVNVLNTGARTTGSTNNPATDPFFISGIPSAWALKASTTSSVLSPLNGEVVGSFVDSVWLDSASNSYIIGSYFQLLNDEEGITEINSIVRAGFADVDTVSAAWTFASGVYSGAADGYRLRDPARSDYVAGTYSATTAANGGYLDLDKVSIRTDVSTEEGNPNTGIYFLKYSADGFTYKFTDDAIHIVQGASTSEGGRIRQDMFLSGYAVAAVPEPETYAMMLAGLGLMGFMARRRSKYNA